MKRFFPFLVAAMLLTAAQASAQFNLGNILKGGSSEQSDSTSSGSGSGIGDLIKGVTDAVGLTSRDVDVKDLVGTWSYSAPAVVFKSDNLLLKAGGSAASAAVESKLADYYKKAGFTSMTFTVTEDSTFTMKVRGIPLTGTLRRDDSSGNFIFTFKALKKISIGSMESFISLKGSTMSLTFDVSKLISLVEKAAQITGNSTIKGASKLLQQYDGMTAGWKLTKDSGATN